ncbi:MAG: lipopolysaccharide biosynthesis protein, partial [Luminiphilus sp.]
MLKTIASLSAVRIVIGLTQVISPLIVVRLLSQEEFGIYQGFVAITSVLIVLASSGFDASVVYFLPNAARREKLLLWDTTRAVLIISLGVSLVFLALASLGVFGANNLLFFLQCAAYVLLFANLNWVENFLLVKNRIKELAVYAMARLASRILVVLAAALVFRDANAVIWASLGIELLRIAAVIVWISTRSIISFEQSTIFPAKQARYAIPIGLTGICQAISQHAGKIVVLAVSGPAILALYAVGSYLQVLIRTVKAGIQEAVFPELVKTASDMRRMLVLHRQSTVLQFIAFVLPLVLLSFRAEDYVTLVFPAEYIAAVPVLQIFMFLLLRRAFNFDSLFRASGISGFALSGSVAGLVVNGMTTLLLWPYIGWHSAAVGYVASEFFVEAVYFQKARMVTGASFEDLVDRVELAKSTAAALVAAVVLVVSEALFPPNAIRLVIEAVAYLVSATVLMMALNV